MPANIGSEKGKEVHKMDNLSLSIVCSAETAREISSYTRSHDAIECVKEEKFEQASEFFMDPVELVALGLAIYGATFNPLAPIIYKALKKSKNKTIVIKTALGTAQIELEAGVTKEEFLSTFSEKFSTKLREDE